MSFGSTVSSIQWVPVNLICNPNKKMYHVIIAKQCSLEMKPVIAGHSLEITDLMHINFLHLNQEISNTNYCKLYLAFLEIKPYNPSNKMSALPTQQPSQASSIFRYFVVFLQFFLSSIANSNLETSLVSVTRLNKSYSNGLVNIVSDPHMNWRITCLLQH